MTIGCLNEPPARKNRPPMKPLKIDHQPDTKDIPLGKIRIDGETQARAELNPGVIDLYSEEIEKLPPGKAVHDGKDYWLYEGFHRFHAHEVVEAPSMALEIIKGTLDDARWLAAGSNKEHGVEGLRRTQADKRRAVQMALRVKSDLSDRAIADHVGVSHPFVGDVRGSLEMVSSQRTERTGKDGRTTNTSNIGTNQPAATVHKTGELIPELKLKQLLPRILPEVHALSEVQQRGFLARLNEGMHAGRALAEVQGPGSIGIPSDPKKPAKAEQLVFDWGRYDAAFGIIEDQVDLLARVCQGPEAAKLGRLLAEFGEGVKRLAGRGA